MARGNSSTPDLSAVLDKIEALTKKVESLTAENEALRAGNGAGLGPLMKVLGKTALREARQDAPDPTPEIKVEVAFAPTAYVIGRGRLLDKQDASPVPADDSHGFPPGLFGRVSLTIHESELPAFEAQCEDAPADAIERVYRELRFHEGLWEEGRINELEGRHYLPAFTAAFRREMKRDMKPLLYVKRITD